MEIWKNIRNFETKYEVSNLGNIRHLKNKILRRLTKDTNGYLRISFRVKGYKSKTLKVHRIVAETFIKNLMNLPEVNHKDGNKTNNKVSNLEWSDRSKNIQHAFDKGLLISLKGEQIGNSKLKEVDVKNIRYLLSMGVKQTKIAKKYKVRQTTISRIKERKIWKHI